MFGRGSGGLSALSPLDLRRGTAVSSPSHTTCLPADNVTPEAQDRSQHLPFLFLRNFKFIERVDQIFHAGGPVLLADVQAGVGRFHVTPGVLARAAGRDTQKIDDVLAYPDLRIGAQTREE